MFKLIRPCKDEWDIPINIEPAWFLIILYFIVTYLLFINFSACLVPVFSFGENELYKQVLNPRGSFLRRIQDQVRGWLTFAPVIFYGRGIFQYNFGFLPFRRKITTVGKGFFVEKDIVESHLWIIKPCVLLFQR